MFTFTYLPQLALLVFVNGPLAVFTTVVLILNESSTIINMISRNWLLQDALLDTFDGTLVSRDATNLASEGREVKSGSDPIQKLGKVLKSPFEKFSPKAIVRYFMYLPLNFIPVVGTGIFIFLQGLCSLLLLDIINTRLICSFRTQPWQDGTRKSEQPPRLCLHATRLMISQYFQLKRWSTSQRSDWLEKHTGPYTAYVPSNDYIESLRRLLYYHFSVTVYANSTVAQLWTRCHATRNDPSRLYVLHIHQYW
jgi:hypothetical protein